MKTKKNKISQIIEFECPIDEHYVQVAWRRGFEFAQKLYENFDIVRKDYAFVKFRQPDSIIETIGKRVILPTLEDFKFYLVKNSDNDYYLVIEARTGMVVGWDVTQELAIMDAKKKIEVNTYYKPLKEIIDKKLEEFKEILNNGE